MKRFERLLNEAIEFDPNSPRIPDEGDTWGLPDPPFNWTGKIPQFQTRYRREYRYSSFEIYISLLVKDGKLIPHNNADIGDEVYCIVEFECYPEEKQTWDYPGSDAHIEVISVKTYHGDIELDYSDKEVYEDLIQIGWEYLDLYGGQPDY